jgi:hypothetical protein
MLLNGCASCFAGPLPFDLADYRHEVDCPSRQRNRSEVDRASSRADTDLAVRRSEPDEGDSDTHSASW